MTKEDLIRENENLVNTKNSFVTRCTQLEQRNAKLSEDLQKYANAYSRAVNYIHFLAWMLHKEDLIIDNSNEFIQVIVKQKWTDAENVEKR